MIIFYPLKLINITKLITKGSKLIYVLHYNYNQWDNSIGFTVY